MTDGAPPGEAAQPTRVRVLIDYARFDPRQCERVVALAHALAVDGIDMEPAGAQYAMNPARRAGPDTGPSGLRVLLSGIALLAALACVPATAARAGTGLGALPSPLVSAGVLEARIAEVGDDPDLTDEARARLLGLYRKALTHLEEARANADAAAAYRDSTTTAPAELEALRADRERLRTGPSPADLDVAADTPLADLERRLQEERADLAAVQARRDDIEERLAFQRARPAAVRQRLTAAAEERERLGAALRLAAAEAAAAPGSTLDEARRWEQETRYQALSSEIRMLDQELLSRDARLALLETRRDREVAAADWIEARIAALTGRILTVRQHTARAATADAERVRRATAGMDPALMRLSEANAELSRGVEELTADLGELLQARARAERLTTRIRADYRDTRDTLAEGDAGGGLGAVLLEQLGALPDLSQVRQQRAQREAKIAEVNARRLRHRAEARRLADIDAAVAALSAELETIPTAAQQERLRALTTRRLQLLERMLQATELYLAAAREFHAAEDDLLAVAADYEDLLLRNVVWLRTEAATSPKDLLTLPEQLRAILAAARDPKMARELGRQLVSSPWFWAVLTAAAALLLGRRAAVAAIGRIAGRVGKPTTDSFGLTLRALGLTLLLAAPLPLLIAAIGWLLQHAPAASETARAAASSLLRIALILFALSLLRALCMPQGLGAVHFRWPAQNLDLLRTDSRRLAWILVPAAVVLLLARDLLPTMSGGIVARLAGVVTFGALAWYLYRLFHPRRGILARLRHPEVYALVSGLYWLWYPALVLYPIALAALGLSGYLYTVTVEARNFLFSLLLLLTAVLLDALARRWLLVVRRRLAYEAALERRDAALEAARAEAREPSGEAAELQFDEPEVDLAALSDTTQGLIRFGLSVGAVLGLVIIWSDALPTLGLLEDRVLWYTSVTVDGETLRRPVSLLDLGVALLLAGGTWVLLRRLPALLEIVLLRRYDMAAADRYAVTTLTSYLVAAVGVLLVLGTLGASWSQLQWMAAALSVGIGFGLQEIVANFISGIIILFERPIRVGDTVTVGETDGVVTRIRIRATTIRNFDRKELLVPNKEFITGRLLNWSLSDPVTRIVLVVGVAYGSDVERALDIMKRLAEAHAHVVDDPPPFVTFDTFGDNALTLTLRAYVDAIDVRLSTITELNRAINQAFAEAGIGIAFPQRDVHLDTSAPLRVQLEDRRGSAGG